MKILQIAYSSEIAGGEKVLINIVSGLMSRHEFHVIVPEPEGPLVDVLEVLGITCHVIPVKKTYDLKSAYKILELMKREEFDLINSHGLLVNIVARFAIMFYRLCGGKKTRLVNTVHLTHQYGTGNRKFLYYFLIDLLTCFSVDATVCVSAGVKKYLMTFMPFLKQVFAVKNGINECEIETSVGKIDRNSVKNRILQYLGRKEKRFTSLIVSVCRLSRQKNPFFLIEMARNNPESFFLVVGDGFLKKELEEKSADVGNILFTGYRKNAFRYISICDVFFLPSLWEGFPLTLLEAGYLGKPVVASNIPGNNEIVQHGLNGYLCNPKSVEDCSAKLSAALSEKKNWLGKTGCRIYMNNFTVGKQLERLEEIYVSLSGPP